MNADLSTAQREMLQAKESAKTMKQQLNEQTKESTQLTSDYEEEKSQRQQVRFDSQANLLLLRHVA